MPPEKYIPGVLVFKASNGDTGLLWLPNDCRQKHCRTGLALYKLGQWLLYDLNNEQIVRPLDGTPPYETTLYRIEQGVFAEVTVPLVFFSDEVFNQIVAYAPGFGRVGSFNRQERLKMMDCLYHARIAFFGLSREPAVVAKLMNTFDVQWLITDLFEPFSVEEMKSAAESGLTPTLVNGIVIYCSNDSNGSGSDSGNEEHGSKIVTFWTPWLHSICTFRYSEEHANFDFRVGTWFSFMPAENWSHTGVAVSPFPVKPPKGMSVIGRNPLKLRISHTLYNLDQDPDAHIVHIPSWLGVIQCERTFLNSLRRERQARPLCAPRLVVELVDGRNWRPLDFDGRTGSPIRVSSARVTEDESSPIDEYGVEVKESDVGDFEQDVPHASLSLSGGFGYSRRSAKVSAFVSSDSKSSANVKINDFGDPLEEVKQEHRTEGGFGHSRKNKFRPACVDVQRDEAKENDVTYNNTSDTNITGSVGGGGCGAQPLLPRSSPAPSSKCSDHEKKNERRSSHISSRQNGTFLDQCARPGGIEKKNLSGVVVGKTSSNNRDRNGVRVYSPAFPNGEILMPSSLCGNLAVGSWIRFHARVNGGKITPTYFEVEDQPFDTVPVGNTVQIKLNAYVPRGWNPKLSTHTPIVKTDFVDNVVDSKGLLDKDCSNQSLLVWIERTLGNTQYDIPWHIDRIDY